MLWLSVTAYLFVLIVNYWSGALLPPAAYTTWLIWVMWQAGWDYPGGTNFLPFLIVIDALLVLGSSFGWLTADLVTDWWKKEHHHSSTS